MDDITSKFVIYVNKGGDNPFEDIPVHVGAESRKYFHIRAENVFNSYDESGAENR